MRLGGILACRLTLEIIFLSFAEKMFRKIILNLKNFYSSNENKILIILGLTFFVGIWHALPIKDVIADELYFVGGVLRAFQNHTILPAVGDVPYGTLTYLLNYFSIGFFLLILLPFFKFHVTALKLYIINSADLMYLTPRLISAFLAVIFAWLIYKIFKKEIQDWRTRLFLIIILFTNLITALILHTGKMWVLSTLLVSTSFYFLYQTVNREDRDNRVFSKNIFWSIIFSWLSFANFPLNFYALINLPILLFVFWRQPGLWRRLLKYELIGLAIFVVVILINFGGIEKQVASIFSDYRPLNGAIINNPNLSVAKSFLYNGARTLFLFPLLIFTLIWSAVKRIKNKKLFALALIYAVIYFSLISIVATWSIDFQSALRYLFPLGFFIVLIIASFAINFSKIFYLIGLVSLIYFIPTLYFLSAPTTYNQSYNWIFNNLNDKNNVIINNVAQLQLPLNKDSYLLERQDKCSTRCQNVIDYNLNSEIKPLIIDQFSRPDLTFKGRNIYYIEETDQGMGRGQLIQTFKNDISDQFYFEVDYNMGNYFDLNYFKIKNLGKNIYIYKST